MPILYFDFRRMMNEPSILCQVHRHYTLIYSKSANPFISYPIISYFFNNREKPRMVKREAGNNGKKLMNKKKKKKWKEPIQRGDGII